MIQKMKKHIFTVLALAVTMLTACTGDYTDWASPIHNDQPATVTFGDGSVSEVGLIDFANIADSQTAVQVCQMTAPTASDANYSNLSYKINIGNESFDLSNDGTVSLDALKSYIETTFGKAPTERENKAIVEQWISNGKTTVKTATSNEFKVKTKLAAPHISTGYYLVGDMAGWDMDAAKANPFMRNSGTSTDELYSDPYFTITITTTKDDCYWKIIPQENVDGGNIWADGVVGTVADGETAATGTLTNNGANAGKIEKAGKYKMTINMMDYTYSIEAVKYEPFVYFIGATDGWQASDQKLALTDEENGIYTGYIYAADPNNWGVAGKFQRVAGSWDNEINAGNLTGGMTGVSGSNNIEFPAVGVYFMTLNLEKNSLEAVQITNMNLVGDFNGWNEKDDAQQMTWDAENFCFTISNAGVTSNGWKFTANNAWRINLGGELGNLAGNGSNLSTTGSTIKLYPCRKTSDNIYCTVE